MKANELMIGDWVTFKDCQHENPMPIKIIAIGFQADGENDCLVQINGDKACDIIEIDDEIVGIPLTAEILEKNGFHYTNEHTLKGADTYILRLEQRGFYFKITIKLNDYFALDSYDDRVYRLVEISTGKWYVHHLQHALRLCGIEKSIEL